MFRHGKSDLDGFHLSFVLLIQSSNSERSYCHSFVRGALCYIQDSLILFTGKYADMGEYYRSWYEQDTFEEDVRNLFNGLAPLYDELHAYVRRKLKEYYKDETFPSSGHIPAHIFGKYFISYVSCQVCC